jgi:acyl transferase domain-containing protein
MRDSRSMLTTPSELTWLSRNGKSTGIIHPSAQGQEECIRKAYSRAGLGFDQTGYFECYGTGTPVGDPIECESIGNVFAAGRSADEPLLIGSIKTNLGHTEGASGLAGVMKAVLSLEKGRIPATIGIKTLDANSMCPSHIWPC